METTIKRVMVSIPKWTIEEETGYKPISTFWEDFSIAEKCSVLSIKQTYEMAFKFWKSNYKMMTELCMVLNHKIWLWYDLQNEDLSKVYNGLWEQLDIYLQDNLTGDELDYYYRTTD